MRRWADNATHVCVDYCDDYCVDDQISRQQDVSSSDPKQMRRVTLSFADPNNKQRLGSDEEPMAPPETVTPVTPVMMDITGRYLSKKSN